MKAQSLFWKLFCALQTAVMLAAAPQAGAMELGKLQAGGALVPLVVYDPDAKIDTLIEITNAVPDGTSSMELRWGFWLGDQPAGAVDGVEDDVAPWATTSVRLGDLLGVYPTPAVGYLVIGTPAETLGVAVRAFQVSVPATDAAVEPQKIVEIPVLPLRPGDVQYLGGAPIQPDADLQSGHAGIASGETVFMPFEAEGLAKTQFVVWQSEAPSSALTARIVTDDGEWQSIGSFTATERLSIIDFQSLNGPEAFRSGRVEFEAFSDTVAFSLISLPQTSMSKNPKIPPGVGSQGASARVSAVPAWHQ